MRNESMGNDPKSIWQNQPPEPSVMTLEKIREKTQELHINTRRSLLGEITKSLLLVGLCGYGLAWASGLIALLIGFVLVWSLTGQFFLHHGNWSSAPPAVSALGFGIVSYRKELERKRKHSSRYLLWSFGPMVFALACFILVVLSLGIENRGMAIGEVLRNMTPFLLLVVAWNVGVFVIRMRDQRELQREIEILTELERTKG